MPGYVTKLPTIEESLANSYGSQNSSTDGSTVVKSESPDDYKGLAGGLFLKDIAESAAKSVGEQNAAAMLQLQGKNMEGTGTGKVTEGLGFKDIMTGVNGVASLIGGLKDYELRKTQIKGLEQNIAQANTDGATKALTLANLSKNGVA